MDKIIPNYGCHVNYLSDYNVKINAHMPSLLHNSSSNSLKRRTFMQVATLFLENNMYLYFLDIGTAQVV